MRTRMGLAILSVAGLAAGLFMVVTLQAGTIQEESAVKPQPLTPEETRIILHKGTEIPFTGKYWNHTETGTYRCRQCGAALFTSATKFESGCGWPSFDEAIPGAVREILDRDGVRIEIVCSTCGAHLGHVFRGEGFTDRDTRHCVNSASLTFDAHGDAYERAYFAGGCFWGVEHWFEGVSGVIDAVSGYMGGDLENPTYAHVSSGATGHIETVEVTFDPSKVSYEALAKLFFEIHDPTTVDRQGPDIGEQYRSVVFYTSDAQQRAAETLIGELKTRGHKVVTEVLPSATFWKAEDYHQDYYQRKGTQPYCHSRVNRFDD